MNHLSPSEFTYIITAFLFHAVLMAHFALRKWRFNIAIRYGPVVYGLSIPAAAVSLWLILNQAPWYLWVSGLLYLLWAVYGYWTEYIKEIEWRDAVRWSVLVPYISLYLATVMFYWWPFAVIYKPLWYIGGCLFAINTFLNITSHKRGETITRESGKNIKYQGRATIGGSK
jgi:hypothetical protein